MSRTVETNSLEVRWFDRGPPPRDLTAWLTGLGAVETAERTDLYLAPTDPSLNVKLRGGDVDSLEVKRLLGRPGTHAFGPDVTGHLEQWYKWSFPLDHVPGLWTDDPTGLWLPVEKTRLLYVLDHSDLASFDDALSETDAQVHLEVTAVSTPSATAWTCGLEATGTLADLEPAVTAVGATLFDDAFPRTLPVEQSRGYVSWLRESTAEFEVDADALVPSNR